MNVKPMKNKVLVRLIHEAEKTKSGIITSVKPKGLFSNFAEVVAVGDEVTECKAGDQVVIPRSCGTDVMVADVHHLMLQEVELLGVLLSKIEISPEAPSGAIHS